MHDPPDDPDAPAPLPYRSAADDRASQPEVGRQAVRGAALAGCVLSAALGFVGCGTGLGNVAAMHGGGGGDALSIVLFALCPALTAGGLVAWALHLLRRRPDRRGYALGLMIGTGLAALAGGACFGYGVR